MHATIPKLEGNVWETCSKSLHLRKFSCRVLLHVKSSEMFGTVHCVEHAKIIICGPLRKQKQLSLFLSLFQRNGLLVRAMN